MNHLATIINKIPLHTKKGWGIISKNKKNLFGDGSSELEIIGEGMYKAKGGLDDNS